MSHPVQWIPYISIVYPLVIANVFYAYKSITKIVEQKMIILKICKCSSLPRKNYLFMQNKYEINALNHFGQDWRNIMYLIGPNLHKISSAIHREVFVFSVIPIIQTDLNEFMRTWNCRIIRKSTEHQEEFPKCCLIYQLLLDFLNKVLMSNKEIYRLTKRPSLLLEIRLILIEKYMSYQYLIRNITNWEFLKWKFKS